VEVRSQEQVRLEFEAFWLKALKAAVQAEFLGATWLPEGREEPSLALACARHTR